MNTLLRYVHWCALTVFQKGGIYTTPSPIMLGLKRATEVLKRPNTNKKKKKRKTNPPHATSLSRYISILWYPISDWFHGFCYFTLLI